MRWIKNKHGILTDYGKGFVYTALFLIIVCAVVIFVWRAKDWITT